MLKVTNLRHAWPEKAGFVIDRRYGVPTYTFLHFFNSVDILIDGVMVRTRPHACVVYDIGTVQRFVSNQQLTHDWIHFEGDLAAILQNFGLECDKLYYPSNADFITEIVKEMEFEFYSEKRFSEHLIRMKTDELFIKMARACSDEYVTAVDTNTDERFRMLRGEVFSNLKQPWTVEQMAERVGLSKSRFYTLYKSIYGSTPIDDLIRARIDSAKNALLFSKRSIVEISESLGYNNLTHFMRQFKALTGTTPDQYRKKENLPGKTAT